MWLALLKLALSVADTLAKKARESQQLSAGEYTAIAKQHKKVNKLVQKAINAGRAASGSDGVHDPFQDRTDA